MNAARAGDPILNFAGTYVITSIFRGDKECLDANYLQGSDAAHGGAFLNTCDNGEAQKWQLKTVTPGLYQLSAKAKGADVCLNGNDRESPIHDGAAFSETCRPIAAQTWTVEATGGYLRLHSRLYSDTACLESNEADSAEHAGSTFMDVCQDASGQYWYLKDA